MTLWQSVNDSVTLHNRINYSVPFRPSSSEDRATYDHWWTCMQTVAEFRHLKWSQVGKGPKECNILEEKSRSVLFSASSSSSAIVLQTWCPFPHLSVVRCQSFLALLYSVLSSQRLNNRDTLASLSDVSRGDGQQVRECYQKAGALWFP